MEFSSSLLIMLFKSFIVPFSVFPQQIVKRGVLKSLGMIVDLSISPLSYFSFCFSYFEGQL